MTSRSLLAAAVALSAALMYPADSAAQRQRSPGGDGGGRQQQGGERQRDNGGGGGRQRDSGGGARQRDGGGSRQRDEGAARPQGGDGRAQARAAQPRENNGGDRGRRETPSEVRETPPQQRPITPPPEARAEAGTQGGERQARRRFPTAAERAAEGNRGGTVIENRGDGGDRTSAVRSADRGSTSAVRSADRGSTSAVRGADRDRSSVSRGVDRTPNGARVAVPRAGRAPQWDDRNDRNVYGSRYRGRNVYGRYAYHGGRNIYIVPRGRTFYYYPRYYYNPYTFGYGPAGRGHFYFDLHYNSYIWHPYDAYRYGTYGSYGYPVGELRLKVQPRDAQVFIDGSYAGRVDEFDGVFQSLRLEEGEYQVEIVLPGFEPLAFDVRIFPGEKTTYEGDLIPEP
jgi:hypothetical protein